MVIYSSNYGYSYNYLNRGHHRMHDLMYENYEVPYNYCYDEDYYGDVGSYNED